MSFRWAWSPAGRSDGPSGRPMLAVAVPRDVETGRRSERLEGDVKRGGPGGFDSMKNLVRKRLYRFLFGGEHWCRVEMNHHIKEHLAALDRGSLEAVEVSGWGRRSSGWRSFDQL